MPTCRSHGGLCKYPTSSVRLVENGLAYSHHGGFPKSKAGSNKGETRRKRQMAHTGICRLTAKHAFELYRKQSRGRVEEPGTSVFVANKHSPFSSRQLLHKQVHHDSFPSPINDQIISLAHNFSGSCRFIAYVISGLPIRAGIRVFKVWFANQSVSKLHSYGPVTSCLRVLAQRVARSSDSPESQLLSSKANHRSVRFPSLFLDLAFHIPITTQRRFVDIAESMSREQQREFGRESGPRFGNATRTISSP
jgi:hypothetical protein